MDKTYLALALTDADLVQPKFHNGDGTKEAQKPQNKQVAASFFKTHPPLFGGLPKIFHPFLFVNFVPFRGDSLSFVGSTSRLAAPHAMKLPRPLLIWSCLLLGIALFYLGTCVWPAIYDDNEGQYAGGSREMLARNDWPIP